MHCICIYLFILFLNILLYQELETCSSEEEALSFSAVCCLLEGRSQASTKKNLDEEKKIPIKNGFYETSKPH